MLARVLRRTARAARAGVRSASAFRPAFVTAGSTKAPATVRALVVADPVPRRGFAVGRAARAEDPWPDASKGGFAPPAFVSDLTAANLPGWSATIADMHDQSRGSASEPDDFRPQFFNPLSGLVAKPAKPATKLITWNAFPKKVAVNSGSDEERWQVADSNRYRNQDEYCEWSIKRNAAGKITSVSFTSEGPEYWQYLWQVQPDTVLQLYRKYVSPNVQAKDLLKADGTYDPRNKWNADSKSGAMHLICPPNSLFAEVKLGADASLPRRNGPNGQFITDTQALIRCAQYGVASRNSDPTIGAGVNTLARAGFMIAFANPVALYMRGIDTSTWTTPDDTPASTFWRIDRGTPDRILRATYEVPQTGQYAYVVGDIQTSPGQTIAYGGQIADFITVSLTGMAADQKPANIKPRNYCEGSVSATEAAAAAGTRFRH